MRHDFISGQQIITGFENCISGSMVRFNPDLIIELKTGGEVQVCPQSSFRKICFLWPFILYPQPVIP
jgi:hypothetical protein